MLPRPPSCPLFPYTTLFRSGRGACEHAKVLGLHAQLEDLRGRGRVGRRLAAAAGQRSQSRDEQEAVPHQNVSVCVEKKSRSEEHTSELQSQSNLVCRLLLEK